MYSLGTIVNNTAAAGRWAPLQGKAIGDSFPVDQYSKMRTGQSREEAGPCPDRR